jgi:hypothetical protein
MSAPEVIFTTSPGESFEGYRISRDGSAIWFLTATAQASTKTILYRYNVPTATLSDVGRWSSAGAYGTLVPVSVAGAGATGQTVVLNYCPIGLANEYAPVCATPSGESNLSGSVGAGTINLASPYSPSVFKLPVPEVDLTEGYFLSEIDPDANLVVYSDPSGPVEARSVEVTASGDAFPRSVKGQPCPPALLSSDGTYDLCSVAGSNGDNGSLYVVDQDTGAANLVTSNLGPTSAYWLSDNGRSAEFGPLAGSAVYLWTAPPPP